MDTWERRGIPYVRGWNNAPDSGPTFEVTYDPDTDTLTIVASQPIFSALDNVNYQTDDGSGSFDFNSFSIDSPTTITIPDAINVFGGTPGVTLEQMDFFNAGPTFIGTWTGSVLLAEELAILAAIGLSVNTDPAAEPSAVACDTIETAVGAPAVAFQVTGDTGAIGGIRVTSDLGVNDFMQATNPENFLKWGESVFYVTSPIFQPSIVTSAQLLDLAGDPLLPDTPLANSPKEFYEIVTTQVLDYDTNTMTITFDPPISGGLPTQVTIFDCGVNGPTYEPGDPEVVTWDANEIVITDAVWIIASFELDWLEIFGPDSVPGYKLYGNPIQEDI